MLFEIEYSDQIRKALNMTIHQLARRMRSEGELRSFLRKKEVVPQVENEVIHKLLDLGYINDEEFAAAYVSTQINTTDKGPDVIRRELIEKGLSKSLLESSLNKFSVEQQVDKAVLLAEKYVKKNKRDSQQLLMQKTRQMLIRKGYPLDVISIAIDELSFEKEHEQEMAALRIHGEKAHKRFMNLPQFEYNQKMKQTLFRKGFSLDLIEKFLSEKCAHDEI